MILKINQFCPVNVNANAKFSTTVKYEIASIMLYNIYVYTQYLCNEYTLRMCNVVKGFLQYIIVFTLFFRAASVVPGQAYDFPSASKTA